MRNKKIFVGITGGIGSGKSLVCKYLEGLGCKVLYADDIAKKLYSACPGLKKILIAEFGRDILSSDGKINPVFLSEKIFYSKSKVKRVNEIVHPFVIKEKLRLFRKIKTGIVITEAALIFESGFDRYLDYIIEVYSSQKTRIKRIKSRNNFSANKIKRIIDSQMSEQEKLKRADFVIYNNSTKTELKKRTVFLHKLLNGIYDSR